MVSEEEINKLIDKLNNHPSTYPKGPYRVRIAGPYGIEDDKWVVAIEPYNDYDYELVWNYSLDSAWTDLVRKVEERLAEEQGV